MTSAAAAKPSSRRVWRRIVVAALCLLLVLVIALGGLTAVLFLQAKTRDLGNGEYVALGSSFAAGPGISDRAPGSPWLCDQSMDNYAHQVAEDLGLQLTDMTCSGAVIDHVLDGGQYFQGPQIDALSAQTRLVTVTVGGNDVSYLGNLFAWSCDIRPDDVPVLYRASGICKETPEAVVEDAFAKLPTRLAAVIRTVRDQAPNAEVVIVDYATVLPATGTCAALALDSDHLERARDVAARLQQVTQQVARDEDATLVAASELTAAHSLCSDDPWVYGFEFGGNPLSHPVLPYHPTEEAMSAVANAISAAVK